MLQMAVEDARDASEFVGAPAIGGLMFSFDTAVSSGTKTTLSSYISMGGASTGLAGRESAARQELGWMRAWRGY